MKKRTYTVWCLRDPQRELYWNGFGIIQSKCAVKFEAQGKHWSDRAKALAAYENYLIAIALIEAKKVISRARWDAFPATLDLVEIEVTKHNTSEEALKDWPQAGIIGHYQLAGRPKQMQDAVRAALKLNDWASFRYLLVVGMTNTPGFKDATLKALEGIGVHPAAVSFPHLILSNEADLAGARLAIDYLTIYDFKTAQKLSDDK